MQSPVLTPLLRAKLARLFAPEQLAEATALLETECGISLPFGDTMGEQALERIRCAVLKLSEGSLGKMRKAVRIANVDWRDVLVAAGFGHRVLAHLEWLEQEDED
jgi:hypothetical protein